MKEVMDRQAEEELGASKLQRVKTVIFSPGKAWKSMENAWRCNMISPETMSFLFPGWGKIIDVDHQAEASRRAEAPSR